MRSVRCVCGPDGASTRRDIPPAIIAPLTREQYKLQITIGRETLGKLQRVQDLLRHALPRAIPP
jgi:hypothetical protein